MMINKHFIVAAFLFCLFFVLLVCSVKKNKLIYNMWTLGGTIASHKPPIKLYYAGSAAFFLLA